LGGANYSGLTFNGGTLQYAATLLNGTTDVSTKPVTFNGNATIDVNGNSINFANPIGNSGTGGLTVISSVANGVLALAGADTYTGNTTVSSGTLLANNTSGSATGSGNVTVAAGAILGGTGTIGGATTLQSGAVLAAGHGGGIGTLTFNNNLTLNATSTNNFVVTLPQAERAMGL
jgi:fibronectin-binding autotransporter adhesin